MPSSTSTHARGPLKTQSDRGSLRSSAIAVARSAKRRPCPSRSSSLRLGARSGPRRLLSFHSFRSARRT
eukprot:6214571-Heterocapsa_arctica.AAC.1